MAVRHVLLAVAALASGCSSHRSYQVADPVVGPAPPRIADAEQVAAQSPDDTVLQTSYETGPIPMTGVVARVNGHPILAGDVLEEYVTQLQMYRQQSSDEDFRKAQEILLRRLLPYRIEQKLMVDEVKGKLQKEQLEQIEKQLDIAFEQDVENLKKQFKVTTTADLEVLLQQNGMSLVTMRQKFGERALASEYLRQRMGDEKPITRQQLLQEYHARKAEFQEPAQVKWQQLQVSIAKHGGESAARSFLEGVLEESRSGVDFDAIVKTYSDGPLAQSGGHWDWMQPESIAAEKVREAVQTIPVGQLSGIIVTDQYLQVVKVNGRRPQRYTPFEELQDQLRREISEKRREAAAKQIIAELKEKAVIETLFDGESDTGKKVQDAGVRPAGVAG